MGVGHTAAQKDVYLLLVAGKLGKLAPVGHNLDGADVPVEVGLGMVDIPPMATVGTAYFVQDAHKVVVVHVAKGWDSGPGYSVPGFEVEDSQPAREVVVCFVPVGSEECCYEPVDYPQWSHHNIEDLGEVYLDNSSDLNHMD